MTPTQAPAKDLTWIKRQLQLAIELELSTLPLYLSSMFSLEVQNYTVYNSIRGVAMEEMVHMAIAGNILAGLGGSPQIAKIGLAYPVKGLPGGAEPDLEVGLAKLSKQQLTKFLRIEMPDVLLRKMNRGEAYPTISVFYCAIRQAVRENADAVRAAVKAGGPANQMGDDIGFTTIQYKEGGDAVADICAAIDEIVEQGEGARAETLITPHADDYEQSHYAKLAAIYRGHEYQEPKPRIELSRETEKLFFQGMPIGWPVVVNTLAVPGDGYAKILALDPNAAAVTTDLQAFDNGFSAVLTALDSAFNGPAPVAWKTLGGAVHSMVDLRVLSCFNLLRHEIPASIVAQLAGLYPGEVERLGALTDLARPVFYGPRFVNTNL